LTNRIFRIAIQAESAVIILINQQASAFGTDVSGQFFASPPQKLTGPIEAQRHPHLHDRASQEAAGQAVVKVSGSDFSSRHNLNGVVLKDRSITAARVSAQY
jgi:hypothetical protein